MKVLIFGAGGMLGQGVLRECLLADDVSEIVAIGRSPVSQSFVPNSTKFSQRQFADLMQADLSEFADFDACFYTIGMTSSGHSEAEYRATMQDLPLTIAGKLQENNSKLTFVFVSGAGSDAAGGKIWAKVLGETENFLQNIRFSAVFAFRLAIVQPLHGIQSKTKHYRRFYKLAAPLLPLARKLFPEKIVSTEIVGKAMLNCVRFGYTQSVLESRDIARLAGQA
ncbi:epimerase [Neisseria iguanae]|uniref:Epimerase n=1 Tax=Neisseria iguanae TaxID=90242 RepID=A0A2P7TY13_9NEIS|nr:epimerase [Neisseria iguanae]PSJ79604.1 epimerase [Neisseria iguanae]